MYVYGNDLSETLNGTNAADVIYGFGGNDRIFAGGGNDMIKGGGGADRIDGGLGYDTVNYTDSAEGVVVNLANGRGYYGTAAGDEYVSIEHVDGSYYDDVLIGNGAGNVLNGINGDDVLKGGGGNDVLYGGNGDDWLQGGTGADYLEGGAGIDTADYSSASGAVNVQLGGVGAWSDAAGDQLEGIENLTGSSFDDVLWGDAGDNVVQGGAGSDELFGFQGNDTLVGGEGADRLEGSLGEDTLEGGVGNDTYVLSDDLDHIIELAGEGYDEVQSYVTHVLTENVEVLTLVGAADINGVGNSGNNVIIGNSGNNGLDGSFGADTIVTGGGSDHIVFQAGQADGDLVLDFDGYGAAPGDTLIFLGYGPGASFTQVDNTHWAITYNGGASQEVITFTNAAAIHLTDYMFV